ncbi:hypothetical protein CsSME_00025578 [Camellia sinensis var. sinensis]
MGIKNLSTMFLILAIAVMVFYNPNPITFGPKQVLQKNPKEKVTKFHFYFYDKVSGKSPSAMRVAQSDITEKSPTFFGMLNVMDNPLTVGSDPNTKIVGQAQGFYIAAGLNKLGLLMAITLVLTECPKNSTLCVLGHNPIFHLVREMSSVGESGVFQLARGTAKAKTHWLDTTSGDAIVEYDVMALHY